MNRYEFEKKLPGILREKCAYTRHLTEWEQDAGSHLNYRATFRSAPHLTLAFDFRPEVTAPYVVVRLLNRRNALANQQAVRLTAGIRGFSISGIRMQIQEKIRANAPKK